MNVDGPEGLKHVGCL